MYVIIDNRYLSRWGPFYLVSEGHFVSTETLKSMARAAKLCPGEIVKKFATTSEAYEYVKANSLDSMSVEQYADHFVVSLV